MNRQSAIERAKALVSQMTLEEKVSQLLFTSPAIERLGVPAWNWWNEALHGVARAGLATMFPQAIGLAAAFDRDLMRKVGEVISTEGRAKYNEARKRGDRDIYKCLTFWSPNVNIFRDPRWGRGQETYGEDPYLTAELGSEFVGGIQQEGEFLKAAACAKHYAVHSGPEALRHEFDAQPSLRDLRETYLPAFEKLVKEAKVEGVMGAYNRVFGEPACANSVLMGDILRGEWGFEGYFTSDCWAIADFHLHHGVTATPVESAALALKHGCDTNCGNMYGYLIAACREGKVTEEEIDSSAVRLFTERFLLGDFDKTEWDDLGYADVDTPESRALNLRAAEESVVMLKNNGVLPIEQNKYKSIAVIGPNAYSHAALEGNYMGTPGEYVTLIDGVREAFPNSRIYYSEGSALYKNKVEALALQGDRLSEAAALTELADITILCVGLDGSIEGEEGTAGDSNLGWNAGDKSGLMLPESQQKLCETVSASARKAGKPLVILLTAGSAIDLGQSGQLADAVLCCWYPGGLGGRAVGRILNGTVSPSGRLPVTFYKDSAELPDFTDYSMENRTYRFYKGEPLYPFGFGLSYTTFMYSELKLAESSVKNGDAVNLAVKVKNTGKYEAVETVELYLSFENAPVRAPIYKLCGFGKAALAPGEEKQLAFTIKPESMRLYTDEGEAFIPNGKYVLWAGGSLPDARSKALGAADCIKAVFEVI